MCEITITVYIQFTNTVELFLLPCYYGHDNEYMKLHLAILIAM